MLFSTVGLAAAVMVGCTAQSAETTALNAINNICHELHQNEVIRNALKQRIDEAKKRLGELTSETAALTLAFTKNVNTDQGKAYGVLLAVAWHRLNLQRTALATNVQPNLDAIEAIDRRSAQLSQLQRSAGGEKDISTVTACGGDASIITTKGNAAHITAKFSRTPPNGNKCPEDTGATSKIEALSATLPTLKQLKLTSDALLTSNEITVTAAAAGNTASTWLANTDKTLCSANSRDDKLNSNTDMITIASITRGNKPTTPSEATITTGDVNECSEQGPDTEPLIVTAKKFGYVICKARKATIDIQKTLSETNSDSLRQDSALIQAALIVTNGEAKGDEDTPKKTAAVDAVFGEKSVDVNKIYLQSLDSTTIKQKTGNDHPTATIGAVVKQSQISAALASELQPPRKQTCSETAKPTEKVNSIEEEQCKDKPQGECKEENGCVFKDGKCVAKVTAEVAEKVGTQNTTGRNSFVINKAPLLLVFLPLYLNVKNILHNCVILCNFIFAILRNFKNL
uniref:Variant surface glycoprotein 1125.534 n=1 Tax=Trypanosoma brucei TaxID=5691 RepID=A0A1J0R608_9TRYP|nr:variant surface glycoprotein 1125.534 [Trypanosoma brucei]